MLLFSATTNAYDFEVDGIYYNILSAADKTVEVTKGDIDYSNPTPCYKGNVVIPRTVKYSNMEFSITAIGDNAFNLGADSNYELISVSLPEGIATIGSYAFAYCENLTTVNLPSTLTSIGKSAFEGCKNILVDFLPDNLYSIGERAFASCSKFTYISKLPKALRALGYEAFGEVRAVLLPVGGVDFHEAGCFHPNVKFFVEFGEYYSGDETIGMINNTYPYIMNSFSNVIMYDVDFTDSEIETLLETSGDIVFNGITYSVTSLYDKYEMQISGCTSDVTEANILSNITYVNRNFVPVSIKKSAFANVSSLKNITIPSCITSIGANAFSGCTGINCVTTKAAKPVDIMEGTFDGLAQVNAILYVPQGCLNTYQNADVWKGFGIIRETGVAYNTLTISVNKGGTVGCGNAIFTNTVANVDVLSGNVEVTIKPESDYEIEKVEFGGNDVTSQIANGKLIISIYDDANLIVTFKLVSTECTVTMADDIATFCCAYDLDFTNVSGLKAYLAGGYDKANGKVMLMRVNSVPAGTGLILMGESGTYKVPYSTSIAFYTNLLKGVTASTTINPTDGSNTNFILANGTNGIGFYAVSSSGELAAGKAYLQLPTSAAQAKSVKMVFEDETTGIVENYEFENKNNDGTVYDLMGRKVKNMTKGMYIMNGKKVIIK